MIIFRLLYYHKIMKKNVFIISVLLCVSLAGCSKAGKSAKEQSVEAKIEQTASSVTVTGSNATLSVAEDVGSIVINGDNNQVSTEGTINNSNE